jgi:hypothetical protein
MVGAEVSIEAADPVSALFGEAPTRVIASLGAAKLADLKERAARAGVPVAELGRTTASGFAIRSAGGDLMKLDLASLRDARERCLAGIVGE